ncbi:hypothetical protein [Mesorhizobium sp.]|uniref:hypothetical protein n=1 Tax=Mesorhizobium sp. TaxID=1871066 RepID=UPI000FE7982C|nr:hypothetical protein [Mesorhizobium sp.]RWO22806.1 MAG: hypothetical protein EOS09_19235 [Mesorhizobium sp.]
MTDLVTMNTANPTRKLTAATVGIAIVEVIRTALTNFAPGWSDPAMWTALSPIIVFACGWFIRDEATVVITQEPEQ